MNTDNEGAVTSGTEPAGGDVPPAPAGVTPAGVTPADVTPADVTPAGVTPADAGPRQPLPGRSLTRTDLRWGGIVALTLVVVGAIAAPLWVWLSPRASGTVVAAGVVIANQPESEAAIAADGRFVFITLAIGVIAGVLAWLPRGSRGWFMPVALAAGGLAGAVVTKVVGELLTSPPSAAVLDHVHAAVLAPVRLRATAAVVVEAFAAVVIYLIIVGFAEHDDLRRHQ